MKITDKINNKKGQLMPFIAILMILLILYTAFQFGLMGMYLTRTKIRDAVDAAALAAIANAKRTSKATYLYERRVYLGDLNGNGKRDPSEYEWQPRSRDYKDYITIDSNISKSIAEEYLAKNLVTAGIKHAEIKNLKVNVKKDNTRLKTIVVNRPHFEGVYSYTEAFPAYVDVEVTATVEVPVSMGVFFKKEKTPITVTATARKRLQIPYRD
ncbi:MAG: pilus assembly protein TadG-related protein [Thermovenabulum sp.]|uniref:pilus assembly protein TadG-related protein n=1 Tax=Thermovenabulum sp. TaxID=3100335 RepID=UPI003C7A66CC